MRERESMIDNTVSVCIMHGLDTIMLKETENDIEPENVPATARLLMDELYLRLDDQVSVAQRRAHRRRLRDKRREQTVEQVLPGSEDNGGRAVAQ